MKRSFATAAGLATGFLIGAAPLPAAVVTITDWTDANVNTYFQAGQTLTAKTTQSTSGTDPLSNNRQLASPATGTANLTAGFFQAPDDSPLLTYGSGTYAVDLASWSGSASSLNNLTRTTLGLFSSASSPESTIDLSISNPHLVLGAVVENKQRGGFDTLTVFYRDTNGDLQSYTIQETQSATLNAAPNVLQFRTASDRANSTPYTLRMDVSANTLQVRLLSGGVNGSVLASFNTGSLSIETGSAGYLGFKVQATDNDNSQTSTQAFDNFHVNAEAIIPVPEPATVTLFANAIGALVLLRRKFRTQGGRT